MRPGISTWSLLGLDLETAIRTVGDAGIEYLELWGEVPHAYHDWVDKKRLKDALSAYALTVTMHAPYTDLNLAVPFEPVREAVARTLKDFVKFADELGAVRVTFHPGSVNSDALVRRSVEDAVMLLRQLVKAADGSLVINVENQAKDASPYHFPLGSDAESLGALIWNAEGVRCTLDAGHAHASGIDPLTLYRRFRDEVTEVHLSDNGGNSDDHLIPGQGTAKLQELLEWISGTDIFVCLELNPYKYQPEEVLRVADNLKHGNLF
jgi:sugar phosphate isomerase/epimerase